MNGYRSDPTGGASGKAAKPRNRGQCVTVRSYVVDKVGQTASAYRTLCSVNSIKLTVFVKVT
jgi:hypothetical protein